jgi:hypothetical protein
MMKKKWKKSVFFSFSFFRSRSTTELAPSRSTNQTLLPVAQRSFTPQPNRPETKEKGEKKRKKKEKKKKKKNGRKKRTLFLAYNNTDTPGSNVRGARTPRLLGTHRQKVKLSCFCCAVGDSRKIL